jgi:predicted GNAT family acetyltransferase
MIAGSLQSNVSTSSSGTVHPLAAFAEPTPRGYESLAALLREGQTVAISLEKPYEPRSEWKLIIGIPMPQMVYRGNGAGLKSYSVSGEQIVELGPVDIPQMMELTALTKPGPFNKRTHELGRYIGVRRDGKLIAMAGERLKVPGYTEVSAVCTHPEHTGRGYARMLMSDVMQRILDGGETPFLHAREDNVHAIGLYEHIGFVRRVLSHLAVLRKDSPPVGG